MRQLADTMFISNSRTSFHLWWRKSFTKHQKVSKYYENDCRLIRILKTQRWYSLYMFSIWNNLFLGKFGAGNEVLSLRWNLVRKIIWISRIQWRCSFFLFPKENSFFGKFREICQFKPKFGTWTNSNMQNWLVVVTFSGFDQKYSLHVNFTKNIESDSLSQNVFPWLSKICRIQWRCSCFPVFCWEDLFWANLVHKFNTHFKLKIVA